MCAILCYEISSPFSHEFYLIDQFSNGVNHA